MVESSFYKRILSAEESNSIWDKLSSRWAITGFCCWYPLSNHKPNDVEAFDDTYFEQEVDTKNLQAILRSRGVETVWEIREFDDNYELELSNFEPHYNGAEGFWCDSNFDWVVYASHESSITIGGWLLPEIQAVWSNWQERLYEF
ncbi:MAG: hypothetical protein KME64_04070 [Scytonematopsis contorta HA4267-MV1]|jgi:hypothetical protein|nr:hypothetical protein [Scytonematopsis contorta HA4267-MV1]